MPIKAHKLPPGMLGFWIKMVRVTANMSQDALATAAGITERTVQRVEAGERVSIQTRRSLARGLGYDDPQIFDDPVFADTVTAFVDSIRAEAIKAEEAMHPDHVKIGVCAAASGADLAGMIEGAEGTVFHCDEQVSPEAQAEAAALFDSLRDWGDLWSCLSFGEKLEAQESFGAALASLAEKGVRGFCATRTGRLANATPDDLAAMPFTMAYLAIVPADQGLSHLLVPKRARPAW